MPAIDEGRDVAEWATLIREYLLAGHLIDRAGMPQLIAEFGIEPMRDIAIDEWMGASPVYSRRIQRLLDFARGDVETIFKNLQLDIGSPPQFMDFRFRVDGPRAGEFWLDSCGALMDVEPMGDEFVVAMCHDIEDPTFDATACATDPRARMRPIHRPPRSPADRQPHCHWSVTIDPDETPVPEPAPAIRVAGSRAANLSLPTIDDRGDGRSDYRGELEDDLDLESFTPGTLAAIADEVCLQGHLLAISFMLAVEQRYGTEAARSIGRKQLTGVAGVAAARLRRALQLESGLDDIATVLELHPALRPRGYVDLRVEHGERLVVQLGRCPALAESGLQSWPSLLGGDDAAPLDAIVRAIDPRAGCVPIDPSDGAVLAWEVVVGAEPAKVADEVTLTEFSTGADFVFESR